jgi:large repetitive protein
MRPPAPPRRSLAWVSALLAMGLVGGGLTDRTYASFSATTANGPNSFSAAPSFCSGGTQTVIADSDTYVTQATPTTNFGSLYYAITQTGTSANDRTLVHFSLPSIPQYCSLTSAQLRMYAALGTAGRTLDAYAAGSTWTESGATWSTAPATSGSASSAASATSGWAQWAVTTQVQSMYSGSNTGFVVRDQTENAATTVSNYFWTRNNAAGSLAITFGGTGCSSPGTQTVTADSDAEIDQASPSSNFGTGTGLTVDSRKTANNKRVLLHVPLPSTPSGCSVTAATLTLTAQTSNSGRTLQCWQLGSTWTETGVTWNNQPATTGSAATAASGSSPSFTVTTEVQNLYSGTNTGFLIKDATEDSNGTNNSQQFASQEVAALRPQLVLTFG